MRLSVAVVTVSAGRPSLKRCIESVRAQTRLPAHYVLTDGIISFEDFQIIRDEYSSLRTFISYWPTKIGGFALEGRRLYAAAPSLINEDVIFMLNDDDWYEPNHIESMMELIEGQSMDWAYSLRKIYDENGDYLFDDDCEALGEYPEYNNSFGGFAEHSAMAVRTNIFLAHSNCFNYRGFGVDRHFYRTLKMNHPNFS